MFEVAAVIMFISLAMGEPGMGREEREDRDAYRRSDCKF